MRYLILICFAVLGAGCSNVKSPKIKQTMHADTPFVGCWESEDGLAREVWSRDPSGWLFGYALNRSETGDVLFFEQMRIEKSGTSETLIVTAAQGPSVRFVREMTDKPSEYRFINGAHDFPQIITYRPTLSRLDATISRLDGTGAVPFNKRTCRKARKVLDKNSN
jgi:hypothetical protein